MRSRTWRRLRSPAAPMPPSVSGRCRALLSVGAPVDDDGYHEAIDRLGRAQLRPDLARARLLYGESLRREGRRIEAREKLRMAHAQCTCIGMDGFTQRAGGTLGNGGNGAQAHAGDT
jgi:hypothetical protein